MRNPYRGKSRRKFSGVLGQSRQPRDTLSQKNEKNETERSRGKGSRKKEGRDRNLLSHSSGGQKSEIKMLAGLVHCRGCDGKIYSRPPWFTVDAYLLGDHVCLLEAPQSFMIKVLPYNLLTSF